MKFTRSKLIESNEQFKIWEYCGLSLVLDRKRVVPNDPGVDTPAMVYYKCRDYQASATYWCATGECDLEILNRNYRGQVHKLTENQVEWLVSFDAEITEFLYKTNPLYPFSAAATK